MLSNFSTVARLEDIEVLHPSQRKDDVSDYQDQLTLQFSFPDFDYHQELEYHSGQHFRFDLNSESDWAVLQNSPFTFIKEAYWSTLLHNWFNLAFTASGSNPALSIQGKLQLKSVSLLAGWASEDEMESIHNLLVYGDRDHARQGPSYQDGLILGPKSLKDLQAGK